MKQSFNIVQQLATDFAANEKAYLAQSYSESQVRQDFIDKFFTALGWDVTHSVQKNPYEQEVKIENRVTMADSQRRADYAFSIAPNFEQVKFFVEAKKPSRSLANPDDYFQTIRYAWNTRIPIAVLTDFEEFHILDCRYKPNIKTALDRKVAEFRYTDYQNEESFAKIFHLFSREAVAAGSLEKYAASLPKKGKKIPGTMQLVDDAFLEELDSYREILAKAFKKTNEALQGDELTEAVQRTIDRLVFIRFLEDKGIEDKQIVSIADPKSAWKAFVNLCKRLEPKYNGLVFKSHRILDSGEFNAPDGAPFAGICQKIADPSSPYDFNQIPISILGSIYERFLGKVVHATDKRVKVEEKPEVRKAGGVYYTPEYIVKYIVKETVGKLIDGKTPEQIASMAFADIACGSGSFLIEVYAQVLEYHLQYYTNYPEAAGKDGMFERNGVKYLTLKKKKEILLNNIYGVDIDFQATEVTQLSLYLKMLENATMNDAHQFGLFKETILPDLRQNIICGNSLIERDILEGELFSIIDESKLKPMNYEDAFPKIMKKGGFDVVVGNPPYGAAFDNEQKSYFAKKHPLIIGQPESYEYFIYIGNRLVRNNGFLSYIVPTNFIESDRAENLRKTLLLTGNIKAFSNFRYNVWQNNAAETLVFVFEKDSKNKNTIVTHPCTPEEFLDNKNATLYAQTDWEKTPKQRFLIRANMKIINKIEYSCLSLSNICEVGQGIIVYKTREDSEKNLYISDKAKGKEWKRLLDTSSTVRRYSLEWGGKYLSYGKWLWRPREDKYFEEPKIIFGRLRNKSLDRKLVGTLDEEKFYNRDNFNNIIGKDKNYSLKYILALFNSTLLNYWYKSYFDNVNINPEQVNLLPIHKIEFSDLKDKSRHDYIVKLVEQILDSKRKLISAKTESETDRLELFCAAIDRQIDQAVYELYDLTEEDVAIVEGSL